MIKSIFGTPFVSLGEAQYNSIVDLECPKYIPAPPMPVCKAMAKKPTKEKEQAMNTNIEMNLSTGADIEKGQRQFMLGRLADATFSRDIEALRTFGFAEDEAPQTPQEFVKRIQNGKFVIKAPDARDGSYFERPTRYIIWKDPSVKEDKEGLEKAREALSAARSSAELSIQVDSIPEAKKALLEFENQKFW